MIADLADYVNTHFATEEKFFEKFTYERKDEHIAQHKQYTDRIKSFQEGYAKNQVLLSLEIIDFLEDWILAHELCLIKPSKAFLDIFEYKRRRSPGQRKILENGTLTRK